MATTFQVFIAHPDAVYAQQAARAAFEELDRIEQQLSRFIENSDISRINNLAPNHSVRIGSAALECLKLSKRLSVETNRAFDVTIGSLLDSWRSTATSGRPPSQKKTDLPRRATGIHLLELNEAQHTVRLHGTSVQVDLGAIGKGYAVDRMAALLREWSIDSAVLHGGWSSALALQSPPGTKGWPVTLHRPGALNRTLARLHLQNQAVSGSGLQKGQHIVDPRTGMPPGDKTAAWCIAPNAALADALSTAFMVMTPDEIEQYCSRHRDALALVIRESGAEETEPGDTLRYGLWNQRVIVEWGN